MKPAGVLLALAGCLAGLPRPASAGKPSAAVDAALVVAHARDLDAAETALQAALVADPLFEQALRLRELFLHQRDGRVSEAAFERVVDGLTSRRSGDKLSARRAFEEALELQPEYHFALYELGLVLYETGDNAGALAALERAHLAEPDDVYVEDGLGLALARADRDEEALPHFEAAVRGAPDFYRAQFNVASTLQRLRRPDEARAVLLEALRLRPRYAAAQAGILYEDVGSGALPSSGEDTSPEQLITLVESGTPVERTRAIELLAKGEAAAVAPLVLPLLRHRRSAVRVAAVSLFKRVPSDPSVSPLVGLLARDPSPHVRTEAAKALHTSRDPSVQEPLTKALRSDRDPRVRKAAAHALARFPGCATARALQDAQRDPILDVSREAARSIGRLAGAAARGAGQPDAWVARTCAAAGMASR